MPEIISIRKKGLNNRGSENTETKTIMNIIFFLVGNKVCLNIQYNKKEEIGMPSAIMKNVREFELPFIDLLTSNVKPVYLSKKSTKLLFISCEDLDSPKEISSKPIPVKG